MIPKVTEFTLPKWYDLHAHFRQDGLLKYILADHARMGCAGILAMPNTKPPVAKVLESDDTLPNVWSIEKYLSMIQTSGGQIFDQIIVPLYLTRHTTPKMIEDGARSGLLKAVKYYPPPWDNRSRFRLSFCRVPEKWCFQRNAGSQYYSLYAWGRAWFKRCSLF